MADFTLEGVRTELATCAQRYQFVLPDEVWEQNAAVLRDALVQVGLDPADETVLQALLVASFLGLGHLVNSSMVFGPGLILSYVQAEVCRRWLDAEMPVLSLADVMELKAMEALQPSQCSFAYVWPDARGTSMCSLSEHHTGPHKVTIVEHEAYGGGKTVREIEVEGDS